MISDAAAAGAYGELVGLTEIAKQLAMLAGVNSAESDAAEQAAGRHEGVPKIPQRSARKYPAFLRRGDDLVRVGWSKKARREYRQFVNRKSVDAVVKSLVKAASKGKPFTVESLQPVRNTEGDEVPVYEIYNTLAWMRQLGLARKRGRRDYSLPNPEKLERAALSKWDSLQELT